MFAEMSSPPTTGPRMVARPMTAPRIPKARPRSRGGMLTWITDSTCGYMSALNAPCTTRDTTSAVAVGAAPHAAEATVKPTMPMMKRRLRPKMSPSRAPVMSVMANASRYPATTSWISAEDACSSRWIDGMATFTMLTSINWTKVAVMMIASVKPTLALSARASRAARRSSRRLPEPSRDVIGALPCASSPGLRSALGHRLVDGVEDPVGAELLEEPGPFQGVRHVALGARHGDLDVSVPQLVQQGGDRTRAGVVDVAHGVRVENEERCRRRRLVQGRVHLGAEVGRVRVVEGRHELHDDHAGDRGGPLVVPEGRPAGRARDAPELQHRRTCRPPGPVEDGEADGHPDPLFDPDEGHGQQGDHGQAELHAGVAQHRDQLAQVEDARGDEHEHRGQGGERDIGEEAGRRDEDHDGGRGEQPRHLCPSACR